LKDDEPQWAMTLDLTIHKVTPGSFQILYEIPKSRGALFEVAFKSSFREAFKAPYVDVLKELQLVGAYRKTPFSFNLGDVYNGNKCFKDNKQWKWFLEALFKMDQQLKPKYVRTICSM
jgi:hypothetical protein